MTDPSSDGPRPPGPGLPPFDLPALALAVEALPPGRLDELAFGAIRLDGEGTVTAYNRTEARLSGLGGPAPLGLDYFGALAPCMDTPRVRDRIERARRSGSLDIAFSVVGDYGDRDRELSVRIQSASDGGVWIFHDRPAPG